MRHLSRASRMDHHSSTRAEKHKKRWGLNGLSVCVSDRQTDRHKK
jgi:hypothetical protein